MARQSLRAASDGRPFRRPERQRHLPAVDHDNDIPEIPEHAGVRCTTLTLHEDGRIIEQRDYGDLCGGIFKGILDFRRSYRRFMRRYFGKGGAHP